MAISLPTLSAKDITYDKLIGSGGFGDVYRGTWNGKTVAVKKLHMKLLSSESLKEFQKEAQVMAACNHPQVIHLLGVSLEVKEYALILEYLPKGSLFDVLHDSKEPLPWSFRWIIANDIARGVAYLHSQNILHRDLKSANVLLTADFHAKISDFGMAKLKVETSSSTKTQAKGTIRWQAPELFKRNAQATESSDVYSMGMIFWEMTNRKIPFEDGNEITVMGWLKDGEKENIPEECPKDFGSLIQECWQAPSLRPTAQKVVTLLETLTPQIKAISWHWDPENPELPQTKITSFSITSPFSLRILSFLRI